jgi:hypothetical protein
LIKKNTHAKVKDIWVKLILFFGLYGKNAGINPAKY